jgi:WD40 repeat protein/mono/diheme cytochrome c family protein
MLVTHAPPDAIDRGTPQRDQGYHVNRLAHVSLAGLATAWESRFFASLAAILLTCMLGSRSRADEPEVPGENSEVSYANQIEPIFRKHCFGCHQGAKQLGAYRMTDFESLLAGGETGEAAIVAGHPDESYLMQQITAVDGFAEMPKAPAKPLSDDEVALVRRWIAEGAVNDLPAESGPRYSNEQPPIYHANPSVPSIDVSPNGQWVAVAGFHEILLFAAADGSLNARLVGTSPRINSVSFSPDGSRLAAACGTPGREGEVQVWNTESGSLELSKRVTYDSLNGICWSPDASKLAFGATDNVVRAIDSTTGEQVLFQGAHEDWIQDIAFTPDGKHLVSVARDMSCKLTEVETERFIDNITSITPGALSGGLSSVAMHPSRNEIVVGGADGVAKVYRIFRKTKRVIGDDANLIRTLPKIDGRIFSVAVSPDGTRIAAAATINGQSEVRVWKYDFDGEISNELKKILEKRVAQRSAEEKQKVEDYRQQKTTELGALKIDHAASYAVAFGPDNSLFIAANDGKLRRLSAEGKPGDAFQITPDSDTQIDLEQAFDPHQWVETLETPEHESIAPQSLTQIRVSPDAVSIASPYEYAQLVVTGTGPSGETIDVTRACRFETPEFIHATDSGLLWPIGDGEGSVTVKLGEHQASVSLTVSGVDSGDQGQPSGDVDYIRDVTPVLSRLGCNQGTCHGAQKGKNGFRLSLRGYDPIFDIRALTDDLAARRINPAAPTESLMLRKPLGEIPHEGGVLMDAHDPYFAILRRWIADGSELNLDSPRVSKLEIFPNNPVVQDIGGKQQVRLLAHFADGTTRDVTREAFIESGNSEVATASKGGLLTSVRRGEAAILARYEGNYVATTLTVMGDRSGYEQQAVETWNRVDELVAKKWQRVKVVPSGLCDDATFLRRVTLDLTGLPPTSDQVREFLADPTPTRQKRQQVIDRLLNSDAYVDYWTNKWADLLQVNRKFLGVEGSKQFHEWIRNSVAKNKPYDQFAKEILTATGSNKDNPPASYFKVLRTPEDTMENTTHLFLGIRFNCNKCHDHPFERWTQDQYYQMAAFFGRFGLERDPASGKKRIAGTAVEGAKPLYEKVVDLKEGEVKHAGTGKVVAPEFPYEVECDIPADGTRREKLAAWITDADNPYFAKSFVNRLWGYLLGKGLIEPIDDIRAGNPPTNPELLDHLTAQFVQSGFDVRAALRLICSSRTYQLSVETNPLNEDDTLNYSHAMPRRLPAEVIYDAVHRLTGAVSEIPGMPKGTRAAALTDSGVKLKDGFLQNLGRPARESACECERSSELQLGPIMALIGGPTVAGAIADPQNELERIVRENPTDRALAEEIFVRSLGRLPTEEEISAFQQIKQQIRSDHDAIVKELQQSEADWKERFAKLEADRKTLLNNVKQELAAHEKAIQPERERLEKEREARIAKANEQLQAAEAALSKKAESWGADKPSVEWHPLRADSATSTGPLKLTPQADRSIVASGKADKAVYTVTFPTTLKNITGFRLEALSDPSLPGNGPGLPPNGNFVVTEFEIKVAPKSNPKQMTPVAIANGKADFLQANFSAEATFDGKTQDQGGWAVAGATGTDHWVTYKLKEPIANPDGSVISIAIHQFHNAEEHRLGRFRISATTASGEIPLDLPETFRSVVSTPVDQRSDQARQSLLTYLSKTDADKQKAIAAVAEAKKPIAPDPGVVRLQKRIDSLSKTTPTDPRLLRLRADVEHSAEQLERLRLTAAEDLTWALINSPAFLFNH